MSRPDLLALTPEAVTALANAGLVKRAQRELAEARGPALEESADGTVIARASDGAVTTMPPGRPLAQALCTCGTRGVCRHGVAAVLAYPAWHATSTGRSGEAGSIADERPPWSPAAVTDAELEAFLPRRVLERARALRKRGYVAEVQRAGAPSQRVASAVLATCTVRFLVAGDLAHARCDCRVGTACEHVALAVWAFRRADAVGIAQTGSVSLDAADGTGTTAAASGATATATLTAALALAHEILLNGVAHAPPALTAHVARMRQELERAGLPWPAAVLDNLEEQLAAYQARSARHRPAAVASLLVELAARDRAARAGAGCPVPRSMLLGNEETNETALDHARLISLGARVDGTDRDRSVEVFLADPGSATVLVLRRSWSFAADEQLQDGPELGRRLATTGIRLDLLATGQLVTAAARRRPSRLVVLGQGGVAKTSLVAQTGHWDDLPAPILVRDYAALARSMQERPPRFLRPRVLAEDLHALAMSHVRDVSWAPAEQAVHAIIEDAAGHTAHLELRHRRVTPGAVDALAAALSGAHGPPRFVSGSVRLEHGGLVMDPVMVVADRLIALDLAAPDGSSNALEKVAAHEAHSSPLSSALDSTGSVLDEAAHHGLRHASTGWRERLARAAAETRQLGLRTVADRLGLLGRNLDRIRGGDVEAEAACARAWHDAAQWVALAMEC